MHSETSTTRRTIDDYQPRKQCKKLFDTGDMSLESAQQIQNFSKKYLVSESIVKQYLSHLTDLDIKKKLRKRQRQDNKSKSKSSSQSKKDELTMNLSQTLMMKLKMIYMKTMRTLKTTLRMT